VPSEVGRVFYYKDLV